MEMRKRVRATHNSQPMIILLLTSLRALFKLVTSYPWGVCSSVVHLGTMCTLFLYILSVGTLYALSHNVNSPIEGTCRYTTVFPSKPQWLIINGHRVGGSTVNCADALHKTLHYIMLRAHGGAL